MKKVLFILLAAMTFAACEQDTYDKGTGEYSLVTADFGVAYANSSKEIEYVVTDNDKRLSLSSFVQAKWAATPDSLYRVIFYYEPTDKESVVSPYAISQVPTLPLARDIPRDSIMTDPVTFESVWLGGGYVNFGLFLKTGTTDEKDAEKQSIGMVLERVDTLADGKTKAMLRLYHDQGDYPEYYSSRLYLSLPVDSIPADSVDITINTYSGEVKKAFGLTP